MVPAPVVRASLRGPRRLLGVGAVFVWLLSGLLIGGPSDPAVRAGVADPSPALPDDGSSGCLHCHERIEDMHPEADLSCVDCHGGDATVTRKMLAHVQPQIGRPADERVPQLDQDLAWRRFVNPMDLRVADRTCGTCHEQEVDFLMHSLHGTTAGHLSDGYYEVGLTKERGSRYAVFPESNPPREGGAADRFVQVPPFEDRLRDDDLRKHYSDLARKECMQCHLWSEGRAVRGRVGFDGDYRGEGCAACHVPYALDGLSESTDLSIPRNEPGHPRAHVMTRAPSTDTCVTCHYGDASIGLHFRGLSQLPPGAPGGPDVPGTTDTPLNRAFYVNDPSMVPPDVHHEKGMHCIDCHTLSDVMGDGRLHVQMEYAVEITCQSCHGTFDEPPTLRTDNGTRLENVFFRDDEVILRSKVTGEEHPVPQAHRVLDRTAWEFEPNALDAMTEAHADLECYTCHAGWNVNFIGFHFSRNESLSQLDLLSGKVTPGRVTTQEKVFSTWKNFYAGRNEKGDVAPFLTGFSMMGSVWDEDGELMLDQVMPETAEGLSGMSMVHHQLHSTRPTARSCVECHRSSSTWGMGSPNFRLARQVAYAADRRGIEAVLLNRSGLSASVPLGKIVLPDVVDLELQCDELQGHGEYLYASEGGRGVHVIDVRDPTEPTRVAFFATVNPRGLALVGEHLLVADGIGGLRVLDVSDPEEPEQVGHVPTFDAHDVKVQWPYAYVADGPGGLAIVDVRAPIAPTFVAGLDVNGDSQAPNDVTHVATLFQYSRPIAEDGVPMDERTRARHLCAVLDQGRGLILLDVTEPTHPRPVRDLTRGRTGNFGRGQTSYRGLAMLSHVDLAEAAGGEPTRERDYAYVLTERGNGNSAMVVIDVTDPELPRTRGNLRVGDAGEMLVAANFYNPPFLQRQVLAPSGEGVFVVDATTSTEPTQAGVLQGIFRSYAVAVEEFPLDQMVAADGRPLKDISHPTSRWMYRSEIERVLDVTGDELGTVGPYDDPPEPPGATARLHLERLDEDESGMLGGGAGDEYAEAGGEGVDGNGDGRIALIELAAHVGLLVDPDSDAGRYVGLGSMMEEPPQYLETRVDEEGDLSRLLDGINPYEFDDDGDAQLDRGETSRAFFAALDLNDDDRLSPDELSRHPGTLRQIRYKDPAAEELFDEVDDNGDGKVSRREFQVADRDFTAMDLNRNGFIQLTSNGEEAVSAVLELFQGVGFIAPRAEWPTRRPGYSGLPPVITVERLLETFDEDGDEQLTRAELKKRPDLFAEFGFRDFVTVEDLQRRVDAIERNGVEITPDGFVDRWDLDGDGKLEADDLPDIPALELRGLLGKRKR